MGPGDFVDRITFQENTATKAAGGVVGETWVDRGQRWANIAQLSVSKQFLAMAAHSKATHIISIWKEDGISTAWRILSGTRVFEVLGVSPSQDRKFLEFLVTEIQP